MVGDLGFCYTNADGGRAATLLTLHAGDLNAYASIVMVELCSWFDLVFGTMLPSLSTSSCSCLWTLVVVSRGCACPAGAPFFNVYLGFFDITVDGMRAASSPTRWSPWSRCRCLQAASASTRSSSLSRCRCACRKLVVLTALAREGQKVGSHRTRLAWWGRPRGGVFSAGALFGLPDCLLRVSLAAR